MDIEKEGELFEQWWDDEGQYHRAGGDDYCKTFAWEAWIFAKNQAIPEGFVLVPTVPSERMINAVRQCYEGEAYLPYSLYSEFVNQAIIERMEAQEPTK